MKKIVIIGGAGYIGSHVVMGLKRSGYNPIIFDDFSTGNRAIADRLGVEIIKGSISNSDLLKDVFTKHKPVAVMHFAACALVGESVENPAKYYQNNVSATLNLLSTMIDCNVKKFIFSSTAAVYGLAKTFPIKEDSSTNPINPYGWSKLIVEQILKDYDKAYELRSIVFRYFNAAGADKSAEIGEMHDPETHLIPLVITAAAKGTPMKIFGSDYDTPDGTCIRDYVHVSDIARAHILGLEALLLGGEAGIYNIGNGDGYSVLEVLNTVEEVTGSKVERDFQPRREGDPARLVASAERIKTELGWSPDYPALKEIIQTAWDWHRQNL